MLAYQMIYTACGKNKAGDFSVWAKSESVTKQECDEIMKVMSYRKPRNVPYDPTEEEVETLFPKKVSCFNLSSGRKCIAQTSYIGKVYSELDQRSGNFIIHAYVYEPDAVFNPFSIFSLPIFKTKLTVKEWRDDPVPTDLPQIEISNAAPVQEGVLKTFLQGERKVVFKKMLQAAINIFANEEVITFNDTAENEKLYYAALSTFLPKSIRNKLTFSTCHSPQTEYSMASAGVEPIKIRNILDGAQNSAFNYGENHSNGKYVFCAEKNLYADVQVGRYVDDIVDSFTTMGMFDLLKKVDEIDVIMTKASCDIDTAIDAYYVKNKQLNVFKDQDKFNKALQVATDGGFVDAKTIAPYVYSSFVATKKWGVGAQILPLIKYVYANSANDVKGKIVEDYLANLPAYGVSTNSDPKTFVADVKGKAPFQWQELVANILTAPKWAEVLQKTMDKNTIYLVFDASIIAIESKINEYLNNAKCYVVTCLSKEIVKRDLPFFKILIERTKNLGSSYEYSLINNVYGEAMKQPANSTNLALFAEVISFVSDENKVKFFETIVLANQQTQGFIQNYLSLIQSNPVLASVERAMREKPQFRDFYFKVEATSFRYERVVDFRKLDEYYRKYYLTGNDDGVFFNKFVDNIRSYKGKEKLSYCSKWFDEFKKISTTKEVADMISVLEKETYSVPITVLADNSAYNGYYSEIEQWMRGNRLATSGGYEVLATLLMIRGAYGEGDLKQRLQNNTLYQFITNVQQLDKLLAAAQDEIFDLYLRKRGVISPMILFESVFARPIQYGRYIYAFKHAVENCKQKDNSAVLLDVFEYAFNAKTQVATIVKEEFVDKYVEDLSKGERKKLFKYIEENVAEEYKNDVLNYIDSYNDKKGGGFFAKLFGRKKKEVVESTDGAEESPREAKKREKQEKKRRTEEE